MIHNILRKLYPILFFFGISIFLILRSKGVGNPFVLPDEAAYINLIGNISKFHIFDGAQYPLLYPYLSALAYVPGNILLSYNQIRILNIIFFSLTFFPLFFLTKFILEKSNMLNSIFAIMILILPWSSLITPIWAEPLYFLMFNLTILFAFLSYKKENQFYYLMTGTFVGLTFITKQVGLVIGIAFLGSQFIRAFTSPSKKEVIVKMIYSFIPILSIVVLYKIFNFSENGTPGIGYSNVVNAITSRLFVVIQRVDFYQSFFHQISYITTATFFIFFAAMLSLFYKYKELSLDKRNFLVFVSLIIFGMCLFIAIFNNTVDVSYNDTNQPLLGYGRYLVAILPSIFILGLFALNTYEFRQFKAFQIIYLIGILGLIMGIFTPLHSAYVSGIVGNPDVTYLCQLFNLSFPPWDRDLIEKNLGQLPWIFAVIASLYGIFSYRLFHYSKKIFIILQLILSFYVGQMNYQYTESMSVFLKSESEIYKYLAIHKINLEQVLYFEDFIPGIYISQFWNGFFDFAGWLINAKVIESDLNALNAKLFSDKYAYMLLNKKNLKEIPSVFEFGERRIISIKKLRIYLNSRLK